MSPKRSSSLAAKACADSGLAGYTLRFWQTIPSTHPAVERVIRRILRVARTMGCAKGELHKVELALHEALINAIMHGSEGDPKRKVAVCCLCAEDKGMLLVVRDFGPGFDPSRVPDPTHAENVYETHGRGIFLMRQLMDEVRFEEGGRQVVLSKTGRSRCQRRAANASSSRRSMKTSSRL
jgi:serine/threonine-protein kinase RsbW